MSQNLVLELSLFTEMFSQESYKLHLLSTNLRVS